MAEISQGWTLALLEEVVALVAHALIPVFGIGIPGFAGELVGVGGVSYHFSSFTIKKKCSSLDISGRIT